MKFQFRYQKVLEYKKQIEDTKKQLLAKVVSIYNKAVENIKKVEDNKKLTQQELISTSDYSLQNRDYMLNFMESSTTIIFNLEQKKIALQSQLEDAKTVYLEAKKEALVFEHLRERDYNEFLMEKKKKDQLELDFYGRELFRRRQDTQ